MTHTDLPTPTGFLVVDKPYRLSSTSIVSVVKARLRHGGAPKRIKVGHGGTLDPLASGVLVVLVGKATKLCDRVMQGTKTYRATIDLSRTSDTDDLEGELTDVHVAAPPTRETVDHVLQSKFTGTVMQTPPIHSAIFVNGKRAYDLARRGHDVQLEARPIQIDAISIERYEFPELEISVTCGKGTYIRSLARDVGVALKCGGMLTGLRRTQVGLFSLEHAYTLDDVPDPLMQEHLLSIDMINATS
ncbi:MAG: tRNA pseudouridine(55) synthase TruB [Phycisphaeraceae bacterium]|nr:tRNA pseudouridine(55) synthase TruB [Phycisphaerales bacterium]MCB9861620.1 tRNA pseudouridine(55) synthase TruB [Phycisphaeraceae bacterium]